MLSSYLYKVSVVVFLPWATGKLSSFVVDPVCVPAEARRYLSLARQVYVVHIYSMNVQVFLFVLVGRADEP